MRSLENAYNAFVAGDMEGMPLALGATAFAALQFVPIFRLLVKAGKLVFPAAKGMIKKLNISKFTASKPRQRKRRRNNSSSSRSGQNGTQSQLTRNTEVPISSIKQFTFTGTEIAIRFANHYGNILGRTLKRMDLNDLNVAEAIVTSYISQFVFTFAKFAVKKGNSKNLTNAELLKQVTGAKLFFMKEIAPQLMETLPGFGEDVIRRLFDKGANRFVNSLSGEKKRGEVPLN